MRPRKLIWLTLFALSMAYVEAALVVHLRQLYYADNPLTIFPLRLLSHTDLAIELIREAATIVMLIAVAFLAERDIGRRFAAFVYSFGIWDLGYYGCLKLLIDWPWFGPWLTPALIARLFAGWGAWILLSTRQPRFTRLSTTLFIGGAVLGLTAFLLPAVGLLPQGKIAFQGYHPENFAWSLFVPGLVAMFTGLIYTARNKKNG